MYSYDNEGNEYINPRENPDLIEEFKAISHKYPTAEQALLRMAVDKALMTEQKKIWVYHNYDRLTHTEIARRLKIERSLVSKRIKTIEKQLIRWCKEHYQSYLLLKELEGKE